MANAQRNLIIFNESSGNPIIRELEQLGFEVVTNLWHPSTVQLERLFLAWIYFYDCIKHPRKVAQLRQQLQQQAPLVAWNRDAPSYKGRASWKIRLASWRKPLDIYMSHSLADGLQFGQQQLYLPNAVDPSSYNLHGHTLAELRQATRYKVDVSFFGGMDGIHHKGQRKRQRFFAELAKRLDALHISHHFFDGKGLSVQKQIECIQHSRINLQFGATCEYPEHQAGGLPERCFGVPACGGFLLADQRYHTADDFTLGNNYVEFSSIDECVDRICYYLQHFDLARDIAEAGHAHVLAQHTYAHRAEQVIAAVAHWRNTTPST